MGYTTTSLPPSRLYNACCHAFSARMKLRCSWGRVKYPPYPTHGHRSGTRIDNVRSRRPLCPFHLSPALLLYYSPSRFFARGDFGIPLLFIAQGGGPLLLFYVPQWCSLPSERVRGTTRTRLSPFLSLSCVFFCRFVSPIDGGYVQMKSCVRLAEEERCVCVCRWAGGVHKGVGGWSEEAADEKTNWDPHALAGRPPSSPPSL